MSEMSVEQQQQRRTKELPPLPGTEQPSHGPMDDTVHDNNDENEEDEYRDQYDDDGDHYQAHRRSRKSFNNRKSYNNEAAAVVQQEMNNVQTLKRLSLGALPTNDPDLPSVWFDGSTEESIPSPTHSSPPTSPVDSGIDPSHASELLWVPAHVHPEIAPQEWKTFVTNKISEIRQTVTTKEQNASSSSSANSTSSGGEEEGGGGGGGGGGEEGEGKDPLNRRKSRLSRQLTQDDFRDGSEMLQRRTSQESSSAASISALSAQLEKLGELESLAMDPFQLARSLSSQSSYGRAGTVEQEGNDNDKRTSTNSLPAPATQPLANDSDEPILAAPSASLRRSTRTRYNKNTIKQRGNRHRQALTSIDTSVANKLAPNDVQLEGQQAEPTKKEKGPEPENLHEPEGEEEAKEEEEEEEEEEDKERENRRVDHISPVQPLQVRKEIRTPSMMTDDSMIPHLVEKEEKKKATSPPPSPPKKEKKKWGWLFNNEKEKEKEKEKEREKEKEKEREKAQSPSELDKSSVDKLLNRSPEEDDSSGLTKGITSMFSKSQKSPKKEKKVKKRLTKPNRARNNDRESEPVGGIQGMPPTTAEGHMIQNAQPYSYHYQQASAPQPVDQQQQYQAQVQQQQDVQLPYNIPLHQMSDKSMVMLYHRYPLHIERAIYRLSHLKLANPRRPLAQQVLLSNFMYAYLNLINHGYQQQQQQQQMAQMQEYEYDYDYEYEYDAAEQYHKHHHQQQHHQQQQYPAEANSPDSSSSSSSSSGSPVDLWQGDE